MGRMNPYWLEVKIVIIQLIIILLDAYFVPGGFMCIILCNLHKNSIRWETTSILEMKKL